MKDNVAWLGGYYILDDEDNPVPARDVLSWGRWFESASRSGTSQRIIRQDETKRYLVSTVFLGIDHGFSRADGTDPILFETMVFPAGEWGDPLCQRYATKEQALQGHQEALRWAKRYFSLWNRCLRWAKSFFKEPNS